MEHEVSVVSARGVAAAIDAARFEIVPLGITVDGLWLPPLESAKVLASDAKRVERPGGAERRLVVDPGFGGLVVIAPRGDAHPVPLDVVFSVVHGWGGEDGRIQGLLDLADVACVGPGVLGSAVGMDKQISKALFEERGFPVGPWRSILRESWMRDRSGEEARVLESLGLPLFAKPANGGSSVGISKVRNAGEIHAALELAFAHDRKVVVEKGLDVREVECAVLGNELPESSVPGEVVPSGEFYDYASKYEDGTSRLLIPAPLAPPVADAIRSLAVKAFQALDLAGMARVDFFVEKSTGRVLLNEVNTLPGFTPISMYPKLWEATGLPYGDLLSRLIDLARARFSEESQRARRREV